VDAAAMLKSKGGMKSDRGFKVAGESEMHTEKVGQDQPVKIYNSTRGRGMGPIGYKASNYSFYDLLTSEADKELRENSFEDWVFPDISEEYIMKPFRTIRRGRNDTEEGVSKGQVTVTQYIYVLLNPFRVPIQTFGQYPGMVPIRSHYLVCIEVGDPRTGDLSNAFVQYAMSLNTPVHKCVELATTQRDDEGGYQYFYQVKGDAELEKQIFDRWFNGDDYYFNSVIYPKIRALNEV
jgi:hypothetical protein